MTTILKGHRPHELLFFYIAGDILFATIRDGGDMRAAEWTDGLWRPIAIDPEGLRSTSNSRW